MARYPIIVDHQKLATANVFQMFYKMEELRNLCKWNLLKWRNGVVDFTTLEYRYTKTKWSSSGKSKLGIFVQQYEELL